MALQSVTALASITLQSASASVSFSGIPQNYRDLILVFRGTPTSGNFIRTIFNNDITAGNYFEIGMSSYNNGYSAATNTNRFAYAWGGNDSFNMQIMDYSSTDKHKTVLVRNGNAANDVIARAGRWANTNSINSLAIEIETTTFATGSTFNLYGRIA
jgi:hypothetical protein